MSARQHATTEALPNAPLRLEAHWDGRQVTAVSIHNPRPQAAGLLVGRSIEEAAALVPRLFSLCSRAQGLAFALAVRAAGDDRAAVGEEWACERALSIEMAQEHLWRLLLDWPLLFGRDPRRARFAELHRRLDQARDARMAYELGGELLDLVVMELLGGFFGSWGGPGSRGLRGLGNLDEFIECARAGSTVGSTLADLIELGLSTTEQESVPLLPSLSAGAWVARMGAWPDPDFCRTPSLAGVPQETGVLARHADAAHPAVLMRHRHRCAARLFARAADLADCASRLRHPMADDMPRLFDAAPFGGNAGLACVETARGLLLHCARVEDGKIADYAIIAPTEWNFHPQGAFLRESLGAAADRADFAAMRLKALALSLDPCVPFEVELVDGDGAPLAFREAGGA